MAGIFISYRRGDSAGHAGRLFDSLNHVLGRGTVFMDVAGIEPGVDFTEAIERAVGSCDAILVVIGRDWATITHEGGGRRLDDPADFVRLETATALKRNVRVIPVLVDGAGLPRETELPDDLRALSRRQSFELRDARWEDDVGTLADSLKRLIQSTDAGRGGSTRVLTGRRLAAAAGALALLVGAVTLSLRSGHREPPPPLPAHPPDGGPSLPVPEKRPPTVPEPPTPKVVVPERPAGRERDGGRPLEIVGRWLGEGRTPGDPKPFKVRLQVTPTCTSKRSCGTLSIASVPCHGRISLKAFRNDEYEFNVDGFNPGSHPTKCTPGPGEFVRLVSRDELAYRADWGARATLRRQP